MSNRSVLIIEDDKLLRESTADFLREEGFTVMEAENGSIGIQKALENPPDLILSDIAMPKMNGYEVYKTLQGNPSTAFIPFIFLTAKTERDDIRVGMQLGADDYITKPFDYDELLTSIQVRLMKRDRVIKESTSRFAALLNNPLVGVFIWQEGKFVFVNDKFIDLTGSVGEDAFSKGFHDIIDGPGLELLQAKVNKCLMGIIKSFQLNCELKKAGQPGIQVEIYAGITSIHGKEAILGSLVDTSTSHLPENTLLTDTGEFETIYNLLALNLNHLPQGTTRRIIQLLGEDSGEQDKAAPRNNPDNLSKREIEILELICAGYTNMEIAEKLFISQRTVDSHRANLMSKSNCTNTAELVVYAVKKKIVDI
jgi:PAS domain S-box-containing protein